MMNETELLDIYRRGRSAFSDSKLASSQHSRKIFNFPCFWNRFFTFTMAKGWAQFTIVLVPKWKLWCRENYFELSNFRWKFWFWKFYKIRQGTNGHCLNMILILFIHSFKASKTKAMLMFEFYMWVGVYIVEGDAISPFLASFEWVCVFFPFYQSNWMKQFFFVESVFQSFNPYLHIEFDHSSYLVQYNKLHILYLIKLILILLLDKWLIF